MSKDDIVLQLVLKTLENFSYDVKDFGGTSLREHAKINAELVSILFNEIHANILNEQY